MNALHGAAADVAGMVAISLLLLALIWPNSERFLRVVCLVVALIVLILVLEPGNPNG